ncbi:MAG: argininosuccinate synthase [Bacteroidales bacterium]|nr:argininosuccinate synthase [Bacteroidales bacterium]
MEKVVLAFSGGLDTSFCTKYLSDDKAYEVHTVIVNTGGFNEEELGIIEKKAYEYGSKRHLTIDATQSYYQNCLRYLIFGNVLRNRNYPLSVSSERSFQAMEVIKYAQKEKISTIAHGSTGAGNDQVRFESIARVLAPSIEVLAPIRDLSISRDKEIEYLKSKGLNYVAEKAKYSINKGLWGTSVGGEETLSSNRELPEEAFLDKLSKTGTEIITIDFLKGEPFKLNDVEYKNKTKLISDLEKMAAPYAIGRDIHVGDTIIGIKGRVGFQAAAALILIDSHYSLEKHVLSKWQQSWKEQLGNWYGMFVHESQFLDPGMRDIEAFLESSQRYVSGRVNVRLRPYHYNITGAESKHDLMNSSFAKYGEENLSWGGNDVKGFTRIMSNATSIFYQVNKQEEKKLETEK